MDWFDEFNEDDIISGLYQSLIVTSSMGEFISLTIRFQDLVQEKRINDPQNIMIISGLIMAKQNDLTVRELYSKVETIMNIFTPEKELLEIEKTIQKEEEFEGENIVSLKNWINKKGKK
mgnify:CR=1 FL=1